MKKILFVSIFFLLSSCNKPQTVLICGDHICVNKAEAKQFFEDNLTLEVKVVDLKKSNEINLVELNLNSNSNKGRIISVTEKSKTNNILKELSDDQIKQKKNEVKKRKKVEDKKNLKQAKLKDNVFSTKNKKKQKKRKELMITPVANKKVVKNKTVNKPNNAISDICVIIENCNINEISKFLVKQGKEKVFPDITIRENK